MVISYSYKSILLFTQIVSKSASQTYDLSENMDFQQQTHHQYFYTTFHIPNIIYSSIE